VKRVALATSSLHPKLDTDGALLLPAFAAVGIDAQPAIWDDASVDWSAYDLCVVRSTWDYHNRLEEFLAWTETVSTKTQLWNSPDTIRWNAKKTYLQELADSGISIVPTLWLPKGSHVDVESAMVK
jgi:glutathione synthase/RimK-type ligase-like ATP-grasp enzyme